MRNTMIKQGGLDAMMKKEQYWIGIKILVFLLTVMCFMLPESISASAMDNGDYRCKAVLDSKYGKVSVSLFNNFNFIDTDSNTLNWDLALQGVALSDVVYIGKGEEAAKLLKGLGYDYASLIRLNDSGNADFVHPVSSMGYKKVVDENGTKNIFAIAIRGTRETSDFGSDVTDGLGTEMWRASKLNVIEDLKLFINSATGKNWEQIKSEENYFFLTGHSWGGATANALSVDRWIMEMTGEKKSRVYTYTYESPHTCVNLVWQPSESMSNAFNFKDRDDWVTTFPAWWGSTTYGKDKDFVIGELKLDVFISTFPNIKNITGIDHHDRGHDLVYILQHGIEEGHWKTVSDVATPVSNDTPGGVVY